MADLGCLPRAAKAQVARAEATLQLVKVQRVEERQVVDISCIGTIIWSK